MPVVSAVRSLVTRWSDVERPGVRGTIVLALLCPAVFLGFFLVGRSTIPISAPSATVAPSLPVAHVGAAIPALREAPPIEAIASVRHGSSPRSASTLSSTAAQPAAPRAPTPVSTTRPEGSPTSTSTPSPARSAPAPAHRSQPRESGHVSFDTSG